jgi:hypothetical protein
VLHSNLRLLAVNLLKAERLRGRYSIRFAAGRRVYIGFRKETEMIRE